MAAARESDCVFRETDLILFMCLIHTNAGSLLSFPCLCFPVRASEGNKTIDGLHSRKSFFPSECVFEALCLFLIHLINVPFHRSKQLLC